MKIRVLSDLHVDINWRYPLELDDKDTFTIVAGDTANNVDQSIAWTQKNVKQGLVIAGNHLVYENDKQPVSSLKQRFANAFPLDSPVTFLDCMVGTVSKEVNNILFVGTTLYTDYRLLPDMPEHYARAYSSDPRYGMNDFYLGYTNDEGQIRHIKTADYQRWFMESKKEIMKAVVKNPDKEIVLVTHHGPSPQCCQATQDFYGYHGMPKRLQPSYASNLEPFIEAHPNIKLWICGHAHYRRNFRIGSCLVMMNPRGYGSESCEFNPNTFVDTKNWTCFQEPFCNSSWAQERKKELNEILRGPAGLFL